MGKWTTLLVVVAAAVIYYILKKRGQQIHLITPAELRERYDYIIVGAGSSGSVVASRLSEDPEVTVLLLEAGPDESTNLLVAAPALYSLQWNTGLDWNITTVKQERACRNFKTCQWPRGKMLGGSSSMNAMVYARGSRLDYDYWSQHGATGWSYAEVLPYFLKSQDADTQDLLDSGYHRAGGPLRTSVSEVRPFVSLALQAAERLGYPVKDYNQPDSLGFAVAQTTVRDGVRESTDVAFLREASRRDNLHILTAAHVTKVLIEDATAQGVEMVLEGGRREVRAGREVVLSAGAVGSPHLLLLSGVGPAEQLQEFQIPVKADLPVGENLHDHLLFPVAFSSDEPIGELVADLSSVSSLARYLLFGTGPLGVSPIQGVGFYNLANRSDAEPDLEYHFVSADMSGSPVPEYQEYIDKLGVTPESRAWLLDIQRDLVWGNKACPGCTWMGVTALLQPKSRGALRLASADPLTLPLVDPRYFEEEEDFETMLAGVKRLFQLVDTPPLKSAGSRPVVSAALPGCQHLPFMGDAFLRCWVRLTSWTVFHPVGSAKMGGLEDPGAVLDPSLRVKGISDLRVVDCSIMPRIVSANTNAPAIMIGEKAADLIRGVDTVQHIRRELSEKGIID